MSTVAIHEVTRSNTKECGECGDSYEAGEKSRSRYCKPCRSRRVALAVSKKVWEKRRRKYFPNERIDMIIRSHYMERLKNGGHPGHLPSCAEIGAKFGWPKYQVAKRASELGLARVKEKPWSEEELAIVERFAYLTTARIAMRLRKAGFQRSANAVKVKTTRLGVKLTHEYYSARQVAKMFGVDDHVVTRWIRVGYLKAKRKGTERTERQGGDQYLLRDKDVREFVCAHPCEFDIRRVDQVWFLNMIMEGKIGGGLK